MTTKLNLKDWAEEDRPREKLQIKGASALSKAELIAIIIGSGSMTKTAVELSQEILSNNKNRLGAISKLSIEELCEYNGIGPAKAISIVAALELSRRKLKEEIEVMCKVTSSKDAFNYLKPYFLDLLNEEFRLLYLNRANQIIGTERLSSGGRSGTVVDGKVLFKRALSNDACALILAHNHPSGQLTPSLADKKMTMRIKDFGQMIDCPVLDHLIIGGSDYFSFADQGMMDAG